MITDEEYITKLRECKHSEVSFTNNAISGEYCYKCNLIMKLQIHYPLDVDYILSMLNNISKQTTENVKE